MVRNQPSLSQFNITRVVSTRIGNVFRVKVRAFNAAGYIDSPILGVILAGLPLQPPAPLKLDAGCSQSQITINISNYPISSNGGCDILSYNIQMDDGLGGMY